MKIYLDDLRATPDTWHRCYKVEEVQRLLCEALLGGEEITHMSLDHDLGFAYLCFKCCEFGAQKCEDDCLCICHNNVSNCPTGHDLVKWMTQHDMWPTNKPIVHSANPVGRINMQAVIDRYWHPPYKK